MADQKPRAATELGDILSEEDSARQKQRLSDWQQRWVIPVTDTSIGNMVRLMEEHPAKFLGIVTTDLDAMQRDMTDFSKRLGYLLEVLWIPRTEESYYVFLRRKMEQLN